MSARRALASSIDRSAFMRRTPSSGSGRSEVNWRPIFLGSLRSCLSALILDTLPAIFLAFVVLPRSKGIFTRLTEILNRASKRKGRPESRSLALESPPERRPADLRWPLHNDKAGALQMLHEPLGGDLRNDLVGVVDAPTALVAQGEGKAPPLGRNCRRERSVARCKAIPASRPLPSPTHQAVYFLSGGRPRFARSASRVLDVYARRWGTLP